jgi:hypothetical protein
MQTTKMKNSSGAGDVGIGGVVQVVFIVLKLCKLINWSWWWVLSPTWIGLIVVAIVFGILFLIK